jgi:phenylacetic acid degradation operon negative regulatory protein
MAVSLQEVNGDLLARFRRQRPVRGGSLIVTLFGDAIMPRGGVIALRSLIQLAALFGLNERLVRTATSRLALDGWLEARRSRKLGEYQLSPSGRERFAEATKRIYGEPHTPWTGRWTIVVLPELPALQRQKLTRELSWHGFGQLRAGIFAHPEVKLDDLDLGTWERKLPKNTLYFEASLSDATEPQSLVALGWDIAELGKRYQGFVDRYSRALLALQAGKAAPQAAFILRTLLIHEYRKLHLRDPLLPQRLLPASWPGTRAAVLCKEIYSRIFPASEAFLSETAVRLDGRLPKGEPSVLKRFGGLSVT